MSDKDSDVKKVYFTVLYFNCLNCPPTTFEVWHHFLDFSQKGEGISFQRVIEILSFLKTEKRIFHKNGFWSIEKEKKIEQQRIIKQKNSLTKLKKVKKRLGWTKCLPFIRGIFITGTLSQQTSSKNSDWDVLIITKKNRIWLARLILTIFLFSTGQKRTDLKIKNRFCLNHFLTDKNLISEKRNEYTSYEYTFIFPVLNERLFNDFIRLNWNWMRRFSPNFQFPEKHHSVFLIKERWSLKWRNLFEISLEAFGIAGFLNQFCKNKMAKRIKRKSKNFESGAIIIYNDGELAFWPEFKNLNKILKI